MTMAGDEKLLPCRSGQADNALRHGHARHRGGSKASPTYQSWCAMHTRCRLTGRANAARYLDKGITVCDRWRSFESFLSDMGERPAGTTLDRINSDADYTPDNCRWATPCEQARNTRRNRLDLSTATQVAVARLSGEKCRAIAGRFGISESLPREIVKGRCWPDALAAAKEIVNGNA